MRNDAALRRLFRITSVLGPDAGAGAEVPPLPIAIGPSAGPSELVDAFVAEAEYWLSRPLLAAPTARQTHSGKLILALSSDKQFGVLFEALERAAAAPAPAGWSGGRPYALVDCAAMLLQRDLAYGELNLQRILELLTRLSIGFSMGAPLFISLLPHLERQAADTGLAPETADLVRRELELAEKIATGPEYGRLLARVTELLSPSQAGLPEPNEPWSASLLEALRAMDRDTFGPWQQLLAHAMRAEQSKPTAKWLKEAGARVDRIGFARFKVCLLAWFGAVAEPWKKPLSQHNAQLVKGLAWACSPYEDAELAKALGQLAEAMLTWLTTFPGLDWRGLRPGNASLYALSMMPGDEPIAQLSRLSARLKGKQLQDSVGKALVAAAQRRGISRQELEELAVPNLERAEHTDESGGNERQPSRAEREHVAAQRARVERLLLADRSWSLAEWQARYAQQPLLAPMVSRLIWRFEGADRSSQLGMPCDGGIVDVAGQQIHIEAGATRVRLWHPIESDAETVKSWRHALMERQIVQPFKQAHRELYVIADTEGGSATDSARFAGHIIRQDRFKALCDQRGWRYQIQGRWVRGDGRATRILEELGLRAELSVDPAGLHDENGAQALSYRFLCTGNVRFFDLDGSVRPAQQLPAVAFSEIMRDVDLFVGVCSVGIDPAARRGAHAAYWRHYAFAELTDAAAARRDALAELLPTLSFADRCALEGRFLVVQGELRTYKIHLGSANVLMSPNDTFLTIPPRRGGSEEVEVFLPFEGDTMLSQILSRAAVLAGDSHLSDGALRKQVAVRA